MRFVMLHEADGSEILVNVEAILTIETNKSDIIPGKTIVVMHDALDLNIRESLDEIKTKIFG